jgi:hypothetical protein
MQNRKGSIVWYRLVDTVVTPASSYEVLAPLPHPERESHGSRH